MKTEKRWFSGIVAAALLAPAATGTAFFSWEEDLRGTYLDRDGREGEIHALGASVRKVFADPHGDRLTLFLQAEAVHNLEAFMLHQGYAEYKGPMGRWNLALGRVPLPWGLQTAWSPDRMPFRSPYDATRAPFSDNGALARGVVGAWDYGLALTQGYGMEDIDGFPGPGNLTGRIGLTPGLEGDVSVGASFAAGTATVADDGHGMGDAVEEKRTALALDLTWFAGRGAYRVEGGGRHVDDDWFGTLFATADYALHRRLTLQLAGQIYEAEHPKTNGSLYGGLAATIGNVTLRGGYEYEKTHEENHRVVVQLHRLLSVVR